MSRRRKRYPRVGRRTLKNDFEVYGWKFIKNILPRKWTVEYETEKVPYTIASNYEPDFIITRADGTKLYIEMKGNGRSWTFDVQKKMIAVKEQNPDMDIRIVFYSDGKMGKIRKDGTCRRQSDWAVQHGFTFAIKKIPEEWFNE